MTNPGRACGLSSVGPCAVQRTEQGQGQCVLALPLLYGLLPFPSNGTQVDPICSWRLFRSPGPELNCFYLPASEGARKVAMQSVADGAGEGGLSFLCRASSLFVPVLQVTSPFIHNDLISSTAIFELCATSDLVWTQLCAVPPREPEPQT